MSPASTEQIQGLAPVLKVAGADLDTAVLDALVDMRVDWQLRLPARCVLRFNDWDYAISGGSTFALGTTVKVSQLGKGTMFDGEITGFGVEQDAPGAIPQFTVVAHDKSHRLGRGTAVKTYAKQKYSDILSAVTGPTGLSSSGSTSTALDYVIQADSNLALLNAMADRAGFDWWVDEGTLHFEAPSAGSTVSLSLENDLMTFSVRGSGMHADEVTVHGWDRARKAVVASSPQQASSASQKPTAPFLSSFVSPGGAFESATVLAAGVLPYDDTEATNIAGGIRDALVYGATEARGACHARADVKPGVTVHVTGPTHLTGDYRVSRVEHLYRHTGFETRFYAGSRRPTSLVDTLGPAGQAGYGGSFRMPALVVGQVAAVKSADTDASAPSGWVQVKYGWLGDSVVSAWARVATVGGGASRGIVFLPEVNDEVLIGFEHGDPMRPVVLGGLFGGVDKPPAVTVADGKVETRSIVSRLGHVVEISDGTAADKQHVLVKLSDGNTKLRLGADKSSIEVPAGKELLIKVGENHIKFGTDNSVEIAADKITLNAKSGVTIKTTTGDVALESSSGGFTAKGMQVSVKAQATGAVEASGPLTLKGATVAIN